MRIGDLAQSTGTAVETIRFYEREGLIPAARRAGNNYRMYTAAHEERLAFIRHCRNLDMTLDEIRTLLRLRDAPLQDCGEVNALLDEHIGHVTHRIRELRIRDRAVRHPSRARHRGRTGHIGGTAPPHPRYALIGCEIPVR